MVLASRTFLKSWRRKVGRVVALFVLILTFGAAGLAGCGRGSASRESENAADDRGIEVEILSDIELASPAPAFEGPVPEAAKRRIVSLIPSATEALFALGLGDRVVGVDRWADHPPAATSLPRLADLGGVQVERVMNLSPDLVLLFEAYRAASEVLGRAGIECVIPPTESGDDLWSGLEVVSAAAGVPERGRSLRAAIEARMAEIAEKVAGKKRPRVLAVFEREPTFSVPSRSSFVHLMIEAAGGIDVSSDVSRSKHYVYVGLEQLIAWKPDIILDLTAGAGTNSDPVRAEKYWRAVWPHAVRVVVPQASALTRPGPRIGEAIALLARIFHDV